MLTYLRTPGLLRIPGFADSLEAEVRRDGAHAAADARERWERDALAARRARPPRAGARHGRLRDRARRPPRRAVRRSLQADGDRPQRPPARGGARAERRPAGARRAARGAGATGPLDPAHVRRVLEQLEVRVGETPQPDRVQVATPGGDPRAPLRGGVLLRAPGGRVPARRRAASRSCPTRTGARSPPRAASCCRCARTGSTASATCSTSAPRAPSACSCCQLALERRGGQPRRPSRSSWTTCASCSTDGAELRTRSLSEVTWRPEDAPTAAEWDRAHAAAGPRAAAAAARRRSSCRAAARRAGRARRRVRGARSRTSPTARSSGSWRTC